MPLHNRLCLSNYGKDLKKNSNFINFVKLCESPLFAYHGKKGFPVNRAKSNCMITFDRTFTH